MRSTKKEVVVYTKSHCTFCLQAKALLTQYGAPFIERSVDDPAMRAELLARAPTARTVPQIWIGDRHIDGFDELKKLHDSTDLGYILAET
jgi:glutaredoxin 3